MAEPRRVLTVRRRADCIGLLVVCIAILAGYFEVPFAGRTFSTANQVASAQSCRNVTDVCPPPAADDPRVDHGASAWALEPWGSITHRALASHDVPLWNPYEGLGTPLAANMQSAVFDPLLVALHLHPTVLVLDLSFLFALLLIGIAAYAAARMLGLGALAATVTASAYGLSGWFFEYSNNQWFRTYLYLPLLVLCIEWL